MTSPHSIAIIIPTWDRRPLVEKCLASIDAANKAHPETYAEPIIIDDHPRLDYVARMNEGLKFASAPGDPFYDGLIYGGDDIIFEPDCIAVACAMMDKAFPDWNGAVMLRQNGGTRYAFGLLGWRFVRHFPDAQVFCPDYVHYFGDTELGLYADRAGLLAFADNAQLYHERAQDATYQQARTAWTRDEHAFNERRKAGIVWGETFDRIQSAP
jgi:glycosyltransferase involved in cell wall biosynthesis